MLDYQLNNLLEYLNDSFPVPVFIYNEEEGGFCGITDQYDSYAYIRKNKGKYVLTDKSQAFGGKTYGVSASYSLIVDLNKKMPKSELQEIIKLNLAHAPAGCGDITLSGFDNISKDIYEEETGKKWKDCNHYLLCYEFTLSGIIDYCGEIPCWTQN